MALLALHGAGAAEGCRGRTSAFFEDMLSKLREAGCYWECTCKSSKSVRQMLSIYLARSLLLRRCPEGCVPSSRAQSSVLFNAYAGCVYRRSSIQERTSAHFRPSVWGPSVVRRLSVARRVSPRACACAYFNPSAIYQWPLAEVRRAAEREGLGRHHHARPQTPTPLSLSTRRFNSSHTYNIAVKPTFALAVSDLSDSPPHRSLVVAPPHPSPQSPVPSLAWRHLSPHPRVPPPPRHRQRGGVIPRRYFLTNLNTITAKMTPLLRPSDQSTSINGGHPSQPRSTTPAGGGES